MNLSRSRKDQATANGLIMGGIMLILGFVISDGGIFSVVLAALGLHVPVVA
jgi:hypothetical protein